MSANTVPDVASSSTTTTTTTTPSTTLASDPAFLAQLQDWNAAINPSQLFAPIAEAIKSLSLAFYAEKDAPSMAVLNGIINTPDMSTQDFATQVGSWYDLFFNRYGIDPDVPKRAKDTNDRFKTPPALEESAVTDVLTIIEALLTVILSYYQSHPKQVIPKGILRKNSYMMTLVGLWADFKWVLGSLKAVTSNPHFVLLLTSLTWYDERFSFTTKRLQLFSHSKDIFSYLLSGNQSIIDYDIERKNPKPKKPKAAKSSGSKDKNDQGEDEVKTGQKDDATAAAVDDDNGDDDGQQSTKKKDLIFAIKHYDISRPSGVNDLLDHFKSLTRVVKLTTVQLNAETTRKIVGFCAQIIQAIAFLWENSDPLRQQYYKFWDILITHAHQETFATFTGVVYGEYRVMASSTIAEPIVFQPWYMKRQIAELKAIPDAFETLVNDPKPTITPPCLFIADQPDDVVVSKIPSTLPQDELFRMFDAVNTYTVYEILCLEGEFKRAYTLLTAPHTVVHRNVLAYNPQSEPHHILYNIYAIDGIDKQLLIAPSAYDYKQRLAQEFIAIYAWILTRIERIMRTEGGLYKNKVAQWRENWLLWHYIILFFRIVSIYPPSLVIKQITPYLTPSYNPVEIDLAREKFLEKEQSKKTIITTVYDGSGTGFEHVTYNNLSPLPPQNALGVLVANLLDQFTIIYAFKPSWLRWLLNDLMINDCLVWYKHYTRNGRLFAKITELFINNTFSMGTLTSSTTDQAPPAPPVQYIDATNNVSVLESPICYHPIQELTHFDRHFKYLFEVDTRKQQPFQQPRKSTHMNDTEEEDNEDGEDEGEEYQDGDETRAHLELYSKATFDRVLLDHQLVSRRHFARMGTSKMRDKYPYDLQVSYFRSSDNKLFQADDDLTTISHSDKFFRTIPQRQQKFSPDDFNAMIAQLIVDPLPVDYYNSFEPELHGMQNVLSLPDNADLTPPTTTTTPSTTSPTSPADSTTPTSPDAIHTEDLNDADVHHHAATITRHIEIGDNNEEVEVINIRNDEFPGDDLNAAAVEGAAGREGNGAAANRPVVRGEGFHRVVFATQIQQQQQKKLAPPLSLDEKNYPINPKSIRKHIDANKRLSPAIGDHWDTTLHQFLSKSIWTISKRSKSAEVRQQILQLVEELQQEHQNRVENDGEPNPVTGTHKRLMLPEQDLQDVDIAHKFPIPIKAPVYMCLMDLWIEHGLKVSRGEIAPLSRELLSDAVWNQWADITEGEKKNQ